MALCGKQYIGCKIAYLYGVPCVRNPTSKASNNALGWILSKVSSDQGWLTKAGFPMPMITYKFSRTISPSWTLEPDPKQDQRAFFSLSPATLEFTLRIFHFALSAILTSYPTRHIPDSDWIPTPGTWMHKAVENLLPKNVLRYCSRSGWFRPRLCVHIFFLFHVVLPIPLMWRKIS